MSFLSALIAVWFESGDHSYIASGRSQEMRISADGFTIDDRHGHALRFGIGQALSARIVEEEPGPRVSRFEGRDPSRWVRGARTFGRLRTVGAFPDIAVVFYGSGDHVELDFELAPGADPDDIALSPPADARAEIDDDGALRVGAIRMSPPFAYDGRGRTVACAWRTLSSGALGVAVGPHDVEESLIIDPVLLSSTYLGGMSFDGARTLDSDLAGNVYVAGDTASSDLTSSDGSDGPCFVARYNPSGALTALARFGGDGGCSMQNAMRVSPSGKVFIGGATSATNFPFVSGYQSQRRGPTDGFLIVLTPALDDITYSTLFGGDGDELVFGTDVDTVGNPLIVGNTTSATNFPLADALQSTYSGGSTDAFVAYLSTSGSLTFSTLLGGNGLDTARSVRVDGTPQIVVGGDSTSSNFPTTAGAFDETPNGNLDGFVVKYTNPFIGTVTRVFSTMLGGSGDDFANEMTLEGGGLPVIIGSTQSSNFPTTSAFQPPSTPGGSLQGIQDAYVAKLSANGAQLLVSRYLGGSGPESGHRVRALASAWYLSGTTASDGFPAFPDINRAPTRGARTDRDVWTMRMSSDAQAVQFSALIGGSDADDALAAMAVMPYGQWAIGGFTLSSDFTLEAAADATPGGSGDAWFARFGERAPTAIGATPSGAPPAGGTTVTLSGTGFLPGAALAFDGAVVSTTFIDSTSVSATAPAHAVGTVALTLTNPDGQSATLSGGFTYALSPTITAITPSLGASSGGTMVRIEVANAQLGATVAFDATPGQVVAENGNSIDVTTPAHAPGVVTVTLTNPDAQQATTSFEYLAAPTIADVYPALGSVNGGSVVRMTGTGFRADTAVTFDGTAGDVVFVSSTELSLVAPARRTVGNVTLQATNPDGQSASFAGFEYFEPERTPGMLDVGTPTSRGGCGCRNSGGEAWFLVFCVLWLFARRRR